MYTISCEQPRLECLACRLLRQHGVAGPPVPVEAMAQSPLPGPDYSALFRPAELAGTEASRDDPGRKQARECLMAEAVQSPGPASWGEGLVCYRENPDLNAKAPPAFGGLDTASASSRRRVALARDLLCACVRSGWPEDSDRRWTWPELDADYFARCLLMPGAWFVRDYRQGGPVLHVQYDVPPLAAVRRSHELGLAEPLAVALADPSAGLRVGLACILEEALAANIVGQACTWEQICHLIAAHRPDVAMVNLRLIAGQETTLRALMEGSGTRPLVLVDPWDKQGAQWAVRAEGWDCLSREASRGVILEAVQAAVAGQSPPNCQGPGSPKASSRLTPREVFQVGDLTIDVDRREVSQGNRRVALSKQEFTLLVCLARNQGRVVSYNDLLLQVWGCLPEDDPPRLVQRAINRLRRRLNGSPNNGLRYIWTVRERGYRLQPSPARA